MSEPTKNTEHDTALQGGEESWALHVDEHDHSGAYEPNPVDLAVVGLAWVVLIVSLAMTVRYLIRPGERSDSHIKRRILHDGGPQ